MAQFSNKLDLSKPPLKTKGVSKKNANDKKKLKDKVRKKLNLEVPEVNTPPDIPEEEVMDEGGNALAMALKNKKIK